MLCASRVATEFLALNFTVALIPSDDVPEDEQAARLREALSLIVQARVEHELKRSDPVEVN